MAAPAKIMYETWIDRRSPGVKPGCRKRTPRRLALRGVDECGVEDQHIASPVNKFRQVVVWSSSPSLIMNCKTTSRKMLFAQWLLQDSNYVECNSCATLQSRHRLELPTRPPRLAVLVVACLTDGEKARRFSKRYGTMRGVDRARR